MSPSLPRSPIFILFLLLFAVVLHRTCVKGWASASPLSLSEVLGVEDGVHYEVVVTTFGEDGVPHAAAMGCRVLWRGSDIILRPHVSSQTAQNLLRSGCGVLNVVAPEYIVEAALDLGVVTLSFVCGEVVNAPLLCEALAVVEFVVKEFLRDDIWLQVRGRPVAFRYRLAPARPFSRSASLLVEASVKISRVEPFLAMGRREEAAKFWSEARDLLDVSARLAGGGVLGSLVEAVRRRLYSLEGRVSP